VGCRKLPVYFHACRPIADSPLTALAFREILPIEKRLCSIYPGRSAGAPSSATGSPQPNVDECQRSGTLLQKIEDSCLKDLIAHREHVIAIRDIEGARAGNERDEWLRRTRHLILGPDGDQDRPLDRLRLCRW